MEARASNAPLATNGLVYQPKMLFVKKKALLWLVMKPDKLVAAILATDYIKNVLVIRAINIPVTAQVTLAVQVLLAAESILNVIALLLILGHRALVNALQLTNTLAPVLTKLVVPVRLAAENIPLVPAQADTSGKTVVAK